MEDSAPQPAVGSTLDQKIGTAVKYHRSLARLTLAALSERANVSTAMISKIERGQVSASLSTLEALATAIDVPLINFFAETVERTDVSFVRAGEGIDMQRLDRDFGHTYKLIGRADDGHVSFECFDITLEQPLAMRPIYLHQGIEFMHVLEGEVIFRCGEQNYHMHPGDSLSFEGKSAHQTDGLPTGRVRFIAIIAKAGTNDL